MNFGNVIVIILSGLGVFHGILVALILWNRKWATNISNRLLSVLMLVLSLRIGKSVLLEFSKGLEILYIYLGLCLLLFIGPLFYLYSRTLVNKEQSLSKRDGLHFLPGTIFILLAVPLQSFGFKNLSVTVSAMLFFVFYGHLLGYLLKTKRQYLSQRGASTSSKEVKNWLNTLFYGLVSIWAVYVFNIFEEQIPYIIGPIVYSLTVYLTTYLAIVNKYLPAINTVKYQNTSFSDEEIKVLFAEIEEVVTQHQLFLEPAVSLALLSKRLKASSQKISFAINTKACCNFNEYINRYRVNYSIQLLNKPEGKDFTIAAVGGESGFNSLSSFNQAFKKVTGKTPSQFKAGVIEIES